MISNSSSSSRRTASTSLRPSQTGGPDRRPGSPGCGSAAPAGAGTCPCGARRPRLPGSSSGLVCVRGRLTTASSSASRAASGRQPGPRRRRLRGSGGLHGSAAAPRLGAGAAPPLTARLLPAASPLRKRAEKLAAGSAAISSRGGFGRGLGGRSAAQLRLGRLRPAPGLRPRLASSDRASGTSPEASLAFRPPGAASLSARDFFRSLSLRRNQRPMLWRGDPGEVGHLQEGGADAGQQAQAVAAQPLDLRP